MYIQPIIGRHLLFTQSVLVFAINVSPSCAAFAPAPVNTGALLMLIFMLLVPVDPMLFVVDPKPPDELPKPLPLELLPKPLLGVDEPKPPEEPNPPDDGAPNAEDPLVDPVVDVAALHVPPKPPAAGVVVATCVLPAGNCAIVGSLANATW